MLSGGIDYYERIIYETMVALYTKPNKEEILKYVSSIEKYADLLEQDAHN